MNMKEKRATDRFKPVKAITVALESDEDLPTGFGTVADISVGGACVITDVRLDVDAKPRLALSFPNQLSFSSHRTVFTTGNVRWTQQNPTGVGVRCGMQFEPGPWTDNRLKSLIADNTAA